MKKKTIKEIIQLCSGKSVSEIVRLICAEKIGHGSTRDVYALKIDANYVAKIERDMSSGDFCNVMEWRNYVDNRYWELGKWLAPCEMINETGQVLIQRRVSPGKRKDYPKYIPQHFTDLKVKNFGWIDGVFVCCDYPFLVGLNMKMKYAKWWGSIK
jgi:hypothetical protein